MQIASGPLLSLRNAWQNQRFAKNRHFFAELLIFAKLQHDIIKPDQK